MKSLGLGRFPRDVKRCARCVVSRRHLGLARRGLHQGDRRVRVLTRLGPPDGVHGGDSEAVDGVRLEIVDGERGRRGISHSVLFRVSEFRGIVVVDGTKSATLIEKT